MWKKSITSATFNFLMCGRAANMWFPATCKWHLYNLLILWLDSHIVNRWVWPKMPAIVDPHAPGVSHSRHTEPPTKGWQLAWEAPTWPCMMPVWVSPRGTCQLCHWRQDMSWRGAVLDRQFHKDVAPDGISRYCLHSLWERVGLRKREWVLYYPGKAGHSLSTEGEREKSMEVELRETKRHLPIKRGNTEAAREKADASLNWTKHMKKKDLKSLSLRCKPQQPRFFTAWVVSSVRFGIWVPLSPFSDILFGWKQSHMYLPRKRSHSEWKKKKRKKSTPTFICDAPSSIWHSFLERFTPSTKMTSAGKRVCLPWLRQRDSLPKICRSAALIVIQVNLA